MEEEEEARDGEVTRSRPKRLKRIMSTARGRVEDESQCPQITAENLAAVKDRVWMDTLTDHSIHSRVKPI